MVRPLRCLAALILCWVLLRLGGCNVLGYGAAVLGVAPDIAARYNGLANQRVGVMTWAERSVKFYYSYMGSDIQADISNVVTQRLLTAADPKARVEDLAG